MSEYEFTRSLAVVIGINKYSNGIHALQTAKPDAKELARILEEDYHYDQVILVTDETEIQPTRKNLLHLLKTTLPEQNLTESDRLLFYFAGHGIARPSEEEGPQGFIVPCNASAKDPKSLISMMDIYEYLAKLQCRHLLVILDCCFAGAFRWVTRKGIYEPETITKAHYDRFIRFPAWQVITSSAHNQEALDFLDNRGQAHSNDKHSPFAQGLFEGLQGDADLVPDGVITAPELYIYLRNYVEKNTEERQTPGFFPLQKHDRGEYIFRIPGKDLNLAETPELNPENNPYRGLKAYDEEHARFFFGRQKLSQELFTIVSQSERRLTTVVGISGSGKSSLVKAGLIPNLRNLDIRLIYGYWLTLFILKGYPHFPIQFLPINYIPNPFYIRLISACLLSLAILEVFPYFSLKYLPISYTYQWQILETIRPGATPFQELFRTFAPLITEDISIEKFKDNPQKLVELINEWSKNHPQCKLLLVIDQFEELITQAPKEVSNEESSNKNRLNKIKNKLFGKQKETKSVSAEIKPEWQKFLDFLVKIIQNSSQLNIVVTLRSDFEPRFAESVLKPYSNRFIVRPMRSDELREVVESPATEMALYFEPANLVDRLVDEVNQTPGALPLLSFTLSELYIKLYEEWQSGVKSDRSLTVDSEFDRQGGVAGSLTRRANEEYENLPDDAHRTTMRRLMLRMVEIEGREALKRRVLKSELIYPSNEENERVKTVLKSLDDARLIVTGKDRGTGEPYYEPAHDFLVRGWDKLQIWIRQEQENLTLQRLLTPAAVEWNHIEQPPHKVEPLLNFGNIVLDFTYASINGIPTLFNKLRWWNSEEENQKSQKKSRFLWDTNPRLNLLEEVLNSNNNWLSQTEVDFVESSIKRNHRKIATSWNIATGVILVLLVGIIVIDRQRRNAEVTAKVSTLESRLVSKEESLDLQLELIALAKDLKNGKNGKWLRPEVLIRGTNLLRQLVYQKETKLYNQIEGHDEQTFEEAANRERSHGVRSVAFIPGTNLIASATGDDKIKLWQPNGTLENVLEGQEAMVVAISPNGKLIASTGRWNNAIKLRRTDGSSVTTIDIEERRRCLVKSIVFSPDSKLIASTFSCNKKVKIWKVNDTLKNTFTTGDTVSNVTFSPDGKLMIAYATNQNTIKLWRENDGFVAQVEGERATFSPDGKLIASISGGTINLWKLDGTMLVRLTGHKDAVNNVVFSPNSKLIVGTSDGNINLWQFDGTIVKTWEAHRNSVDSVAFSPDNNLIASAANNTVKLWKFNTVLTIDLESDGGWLQSLKFSPDGNLIAYTTGENSSELRKTDGSFVAKLEGNRVAFSSNSKLIASAADNTVKLWNYDGNLENTFTGHKDKVNHIAFSPKDLLIVSTDDNNIKLWNFDGSLKDTIVRQHPYIESIVFSPDGKLIASGGGDSHLKLWSLGINSSKPIRLKHEPSSPLYRFRGIAFSPTDNLIASSNGNNKIQLWRYDGSPVDTLDKHLGNVNSIAFSHDGKLIASASSDTTIKLWTSNGRLIGNLEGHLDAVNSVTFSPNDNLIVSGGSDGTVKLWTVDGSLLANLEGHQGSITKVVFSPIGDMISSTSFGQNGTVRIWNFNLDVLLKYSCDWVDDYLKNPNANLSENDRQLCDRTPSSNIFKRLTKLLQ